MTATVRTLALNVRQTFKTATGGAFDVDTMTKLDIIPEDVAIGLSNLCVMPVAMSFYSKAQQNVIASYIAEDEFNTDVAKFCLMRDAHLAYSCQNLAHITMQAMTFATAKVMNVIANDVFGLPAAMMSSIARDAASVFDAIAPNEMRDVTSHPPRGRCLRDVNINPLSPMSARAWYCERWRDLLRA